MDVGIDIGYLYLENWSAILILVGKGRIGESFFDTESIYNPEEKCN